MDNESSANRYHPPGIPLYTGQNMNDALAYMDQVMQVFREKRMFTPSQDSQQNRYPTAYYPQISSQHQQQTQAVIKATQVFGRTQQANSNPQISERARQIQQTNPIFMQGVRNQTLPNVRHPANLSKEQQKAPSQNLSAQETKVPEQQQIPEATSIFGNQNQGTTSIFGQQNQGSGSLFPAQSQGISTSLGYQAASIFGNQNQNQTPVSLFGKQIQTKGLSSLFSNQTQTPTPLFANQTQGSPSFFANQNQTPTSLSANQNQIPTPLFANQNQTLTPLFANQTLTTTSLFANKTPQTPLGYENLEQSADSGQVEPTSGTTTQPLTSSIFGYQVQPASSILSNPNKNLQSAKNTLTATGLEIIKEERKSETIIKEEQNSTNSIPKNTGGFFGSVNTSSQPSGMFSGGIFGKTIPKNEPTSNIFSTSQPTQPVKPSSLGYQTTIPFSQPTQHVKPFSLGFQQPMPAEINQELEKKEEKDLHQEHPQNSQEVKPALQINFFNTSKETPTLNAPQNPSQSSSTETIFTQKPKTTNLFASTLQVVPIKKPEEQKKTVNLFSIKPAVVASNEAKQKPKATSFFGTTKPVTIQANSQAQTIAKQQKQPQKQSSNLFNPGQNVTLQKTPNLFAQRLQTSNPNPSTNLFGNVSATNMFSQGNTFNNSQTGQNLFGNTNNLSTGNMFGGTQAVNMFSQSQKSDKKQKKEEGSDDEGSEDGDGGESNEQESEQEQNQGEIKYEGYNKTEIICKLQGYAPKLKTISTKILRQNLKLSLEKFPGNNTIYIIVRMSNKNPIYFGILNTNSSVEVFRSESHKFAVNFDQLIQIDLANGNKKKIESWRVQFNDTPNARDFLAKCKEILKNLQSA